MSNDKTKRNNIEKVKEIKNETIKLEGESNNKKFTIMGLTIWRILAYFIIYSVVGYIIESVFSIITKGTWESRQSFLYGPFCAIYGLGACIIIIFLHKYSKRYNTLFFGGFVIGSITEYMVSWIGELMLGVKWWDYSNMPLIVGSIVEYTISLFAEIFLHVKWWDYSGMPLNINGRICVYFSIFWGFLSLYLIASFNPKIDRFINWIKSRFSLQALKTLIISVIIILFIDCILSIFSIYYFLVRMVVQNDLNVDNKEIVIQRYDEIYSNEKLSSFIYKYWGDRKMIRTFPNLKIEDVDGNIIYIDSLLKDIQPYYLKIHEPRNIDFKFNFNG